MNETAIVKIEEHRNEKVGRRRETGKMSRQITQAQCIQTKRLELRPYRKSDTEQLMRLLTNEKITKTFMVPDFEAEEQLLGLVSKLIAFSQREDTAHLEYGIYLKDALIGFINDCGTEGDEIEIGYVIHPDYEGKGYATEAVSAVIQDLFEMGFQSIVAGYFEENTASCRVMEKCGMKQISKSNTEEYRGVTHTCRYCRISNPQRC